MLKTQLDAWRATHRRRARIPEHFYASAISLLDRYSVSVICRETGLRPASLRKHAAPPLLPETPPTPPRASFLQLNAADLVPRHASAPAPTSAPASDSSPSSCLLFERADASSAHPSDRLPPKHPAPARTLAETTPPTRRACRRACAKHFATTRLNSPVQFAGRASDI